jgi:hypothetical protein
MHIGQPVSAREEGRFFPACGFRNTATKKVILHQLIRGKLA